MCSNRFRRTRVSHAHELCAMRRRPQLQSAPNFYSLTHSGVHSIAKCPPAEWPARNQFKVQLLQTTTDAHTHTHIVSATSVRYVMRMSIECDYVILSVRPL